MSDRWALGIHWVQTKFQPNRFFHIFQTEIMRQKLCVRRDWYF
jgi:hypothetical protein